MIYLQWVFKRIGIKMQNFHVRSMTLHDIPQVLDIIPAAEFLSWNQRAFENSLHEGHQCLILEHNNHLLGCSIASFVADEAQILYIVIHSAHQQKGWAHKLLTETLIELREVGAKKVLLEVRASNIAAQKLYEKHNFITISSRKEYYHSYLEAEDAIVYCLQY